jgi:polysaccharide biosynthesis/export protein
MTMSPDVLPLRWAFVVVFLGVLSINSTAAQTGGGRPFIPAVSGTDWQGAAPSSQVPTAQGVSPSASQVPALSSGPVRSAGDAPASPELPVPGSVPVDYKIGPNDLLDIEVFGVSELKRQVRVNTTGHVSMPLIGLVPLAGLSPADAEAMIALAYGEKYLQDPQVSIFVREFTTQRITLDGALVKPGIYPLVGQITLLRALAMAGGGAQMANLEKVMLFRVTPEGQRLTETHDVMKIRTGEAPDPLLQSEDMVVVNRDSRRTALRDSLFRDIIDTINPFSSSYRNVTAP